MYEIKFDEPVHRASMVIYSTFGGTRFKKKLAYMQHLCIFAPMLTVMMHWSIAGTHNNF